VYRHLRVALADEKRSLRREKRRVTKRRDWRCTRCLLIKEHWGGGVCSACAKVEKKPLFGGPHPVERVQRWCYVRVRETRGAMTQREFAERLVVSASRISKMENGSCVEARKPFLPLPRAEAPCGFKVSGGRLRELRLHLGVSAYAYAYWCGWTKSRQEALESYGSHNIAPHVASCILHAEKVLRTKQWQLGVAKVE